MRFEITNLSGAEINLEVHEQIMGFTTDLNHINPSLQLWIREVPDYSNSIDDAFLIIEKMREIGRLFSMINTPEGEWNLSILQWSEMEGSWKVIMNASNVSLPLAICEAALQAVQIQS